MDEIKNKVAIFQNFICTKKERLDFIERNTPEIAKIWGDYEVHINYYHSTNFNEIKEIYEKHYPNLNLYNNLE